MDGLSRMETSKRSKMKHFSNTLAKEMQEAFNLKGDYSSSEVVDNIQPVVDITPKKVKCALLKQATKTTTGGSTIFTTSATSDT